MGLEIKAYERELSAMELEAKKLIYDGGVEYSNLYK